MIGTMGASPRRRTLGGKASEPRASIPPLPGQATLPRQELPIGHRISPTE